MQEFEKLLNRYTVFSVLVIVLTAVAAVAVTVFLKGQGNLFPLG